MTVGELIEKQAIEAGYNPNFAKGLVSPMTKAIETMRELSEKLEEPMKSVSAAAEMIRPQIEAIQKMKLPNMAEYKPYSLIPDSFYNENNELLVPQFVNPVQEVRIVNLDEMTGANTKREKEYLVGSYHLPQNAVWESLDIHFIDGHFVKVSYVGMESKKFDYKDMGFINMKTMKPDLKWQLLLAIAQNGGALTNAKWERKFGRNVKYELNEGLKRFFNMSTNPIPHYTKKHGYRSLFTLRPEK